MDYMFKGASTFTVYLCGTAWYDNNDASKIEMFKDSYGAIACECSAGLYSAGDPSGGKAGCAGRCPKGKWSAIAGITSSDDCENNLCPAGGYTTLDGLSAVGDCNDQPCTNEAYYCPAGATAPVKVEDGYFSIPEDAVTTSRTGQEACDKDADEYCAGGVRSTTPPGYYRDGVGSRLIECPLGSYCTNGAKLDCDATAGYYCPIRSFAQFQCLAGYYCPSPSEQYECSRGQFCPAGSMAPSACPAGQEGVATQCGSNCVDCPPGKVRSAGEDANVSNINELVCTQCKGWTYADDAGMSQCLECDGGTVANQEQGASRCRACSAGRRSNRTECVDCEAGRSSSAGAEECVACPPGEYTTASGANACAICSAGKRANDAGGGATGCEPCNAGYFQDEAGQIECKPCTTGSSVEGSSYCVDCAAGTFLNAAKSPPTCDPCPSGKVSKAAASECTPCETGTWQNNTDCVACPAGSYGNHTGLSNATCDGVCPPGTHSYRYATKCLDCEAGKHAPYAGMEDCVACEDLDGLTSQSGATECVCEKDKYRDVNGECVKCPDGVECESIGSDLGALSLRKDHWRSRSTTDEIVECPFDDACTGGPNASCAEGNEGVLCAVCSDGFYRPNPLKACKKCSNKGASIGTAFVILVAMIVALAIFVYINRRAPNGLLRPFILLVQLFTIMLAFDAPFPESLVNFAKALSAVNIGIELASPKCAGLGDDYYSTFGLTIVTLLLVCLAVVAPLGVLKYRERLPWSEIFRTKVAERCFRDLFVIVILFHPPVSGKTMQFFRCRAIEDEYYLMVDYSIKCYDDEWYAFLAVVLPVLILFSMGTPCIIAYVLYTRRDQLYDEDHTFVPQPLDILYAIYRKGAYWFESVQMVFKLALWGTLAFFGYQSVMQLATALVVNVLQLCVHIYVLPMGGSDALLLNTMQAATLVLMTYINFGGLVMNYIELSKTFAEGNEDLDLVAYYDRSLATLSVIMQLLTWGIFVSFGAVGGKKLYQVYTETSVSEIQSKVSAASTQMSSVGVDSAKRIRDKASGFSLSAFRSNTSDLSLPTLPTIRSNANRDTVATSRGPEQPASPISFSPNPLRKGNGGSGGVELPPMC